MPSVVLVPALNAAITGANKLADLIGSKGKFLYSYNWDSKAKIKEYNLLRHYGSLWSILLVMEQFPHLVPLTQLNKIENAFGWASRKYHKTCTSLPDNQGDKTEFVVWHGEIKLGANSLALLAMSQFVRQMLRLEYQSHVAWSLVNAEPWIECAERLAMGIYKLRQPNGEFVHKAQFPHLQPLDFVSEYYVGEALFALGHWRITCELLNSHTQNQKQPIRATEFPSYLNYPLAAQSLQQLAHIKYGVEFQSHWMCYAINQAICHGDFVDELLPYLNVLAQDILDRPNYRRRRQSTPTACRTEALLAAMTAYRHLKISEDLQQQIIGAAEVNVLLQLQHVKPDGAIVHGDRSSVVRIDFIQHNITAFLAYVQASRLIGEDIYAK